MNKSSILLWILMLSCPFIHCKNEKTQGKSEILKQWVAGREYPLAVPDSKELLSLFVQQKLSDHVFSRMKGLSYKDGCTIKRSDLRYLKVLHYNLKGEIYLGEMICNKKISEDLIFIFKELFKAKYPIERMVLIDEYKADDETSMMANNSSAFNFRFILGTTKLSNHSLGLAVDINPLYNPYVARKDDRLFVEPAAAAQYVDRTKQFPYKIDTKDLCYKLFIERGFEWGGSWSSKKDYQHFEKK